MPIISTVEAIRDALTLGMERNPRAYLIGEGVTALDAVFGTTKGLPAKFGPERVIEMPIAENGMTGMAIGSALMGLHPVMSHRRVDFALLCLEQLFNAAAKSSYVSNGAHNVPLTVRMIIGRGWGQGPQHSQSLEAMFAMIPGLKVVMPSTPFEFKGTLLAAMEEPNPVVILEHRWLHNVTGEVPDGYYTLPLSGSNVVREGDRATIVATSYMTFEAIRAADALAAVDCPVDVIDLRVLRPLHMGYIRKSIRKTGRIITCDTGHRQFGVGAEIIASLVEDNVRFYAARVGLPDHPTPSSLPLAAAYYPSSVDIVEQAGQLCNLSVEKIDRARAAVLASREGTPIDKPDPAFKGPF
jgi:pyruvate dehydrogenase E1 component beta subunit